MLRYAGAAHAWRAIEMAVGNLLPGDDILVQSATTMEAAALDAMPAEAKRLLASNGATLLAVRKLLEDSLADSDEGTARALALARNKQLVAGLPHDLMKCMEELLKDHKRAQPAQHAATAVGNGFGEHRASPEAAAAAQTAAAQAQFAADMRRTVAECLFFIYYKTQITPDEALQLVDLLEAAAAALKTAQRDAAEAAATAELHAYQGSTAYAWHSADSAGRAAAGAAGPAPGSPAAALQASLLHTATVLHLVLCCALNTRACLEDSHAGGGQGAANAFGEGNALHPHGEHKGASKQQLAELDRRIIQETWAHRPAQGAAALTWAVFLFPLADTEAEPEEDRTQQVQIALETAQYLRGFTHLGGPALAAILSARRSSTESFSDLYLDVLAELTASYVGIGYGGTPGAWGNDILPANHAMASDEQVFEEQHTAGGAQQQQQRRRPDPDMLDEILAFVGAVCEGCPTFAQRCWGQPCLAQRLLKGVDDRLMDGGGWLQLQAPLLRLAAAFAAARPDAMYDALTGSTLVHSLPHFVGALESSAQQISGDSMQSSTDGGAFLLAPAATVPAAAAAAAAAPPRQLEPRSIEVFSALALLLRRLLLDDSVRRRLLDSHPHLLETCVVLVRCAVPSALKGEMLKALAACASSAGGSVASWLWSQLEALQLATGMCRELESVEASARTYPATEGFTCLLQQLVLVHVPRSLSAGGRRPGQAPYLRFLLHNVLLKAAGRGYCTPGERWRLTARALQVFATLLRRYPVAASDAETAAARRGDSKGLPCRPTAEDALECDEDFGIVSAPGAAAAVSQQQQQQQQQQLNGRSGSNAVVLVPGGSVQGRPQQQQQPKSAGYLIMKEVLGGGELFLVLVETIAAGGGPWGLAAERELSGEEAVLQELQEEHALEAAAMLGSSGSGSSGSGGNTGLSKTVTPAPQLEDWSWWRERSVVLALSILQVSAIWLLQCLLFITVFSVCLLSHPFY
jgi:Nuclear pore complex scaffold, nucleoporins 186/192/205